MIKYHFEQLLVRIRSFSYKSKLYDNTVYTNSSNDISQYHNICIYLDHPRLMHFGDQIFFKPLFEQLRLSNFPVKVKVSKQLEFFFDHKRELNPNLTKTLFVSSSRLLGYLKSKYGQNIKYFLYDTNSRGVSEPITNFIVNRFSDYFNLQDSLNAVSKNNFFVKNFRHKFDLLDKKENYIILNNYFNSGLFRVLPKDHKLLLDELEKEKSNCKVVHIGSDMDIARDRKKYSQYINIDLRGKTTIKDLYSIFSNYKIERVFTFDTFTLHLANIFEIPVSLMFKRYFRRGEVIQKRIAFSSLYQKQSNNISLIDKV